MSDNCLIIASHFHDGGQAGYTEVLARAFAYGSEREAVIRFVESTGYRNEPGDQIDIVPLSQRQREALADLPAKPYSRKG